MQEFVEFEPPAWAELLHAEVLNHFEDDLPFDPLAGGSAHPKPLTTVDIRSSFVRRLRPPCWTRRLGSPSPEFS